MEEEQQIDKLPRLTIFINKVYLCRQFAWIIVMQKDRSSKSPQTRPKPKSKSNSPQRSSSKSSQSKSSSSSRSKASINKAPSPQFSSQDGKLFISQLDYNTKQSVLEQQIRQLLETKCTIVRISVRKSLSRTYSYAFVDIKEHEKTEEIIKLFNKYPLNGSKIVVQKKKPLQLRDKTAYPPRGSTACYRCGKEGHFARECNSKVDTKSREKTSRKEVKSQKRQRTNSEEQEKNSNKKHRYRTRDKKHDKKKKYESSDSSSEDSSSSYYSSSSSSSSSSERKHRRNRKEKKDKQKKRHAKRKDKKRAKHGSSESS